MQATMPATRIGRGADSNWAPVTGRIGFLLLGLIFAVGASQTAKAATDDAKKAKPTDYVGSETCATCHDDLAKGFGSNPHNKLALAHGKAGTTCEGCHGAGREHVEGGGDKTKIFSFKSASAKDASAKCLSCHESKHENFSRSAHAEANVSCVSCHSVHTETKQEHLLKAAQKDLCEGCHTDVKPQFSMPFHHKVEEGLVQCSDCHDPHGSFGKKNLKSAAQQDQVCVKCHTETAGPFVYEHAPVKTEGCTSCHFPHGGPNPRLLNRANVNTLCLECHSPSPNFGGQTNTGHNQNSNANSCTICHTAIHGSNVENHFVNPY